MSDLAFTDVLPTVPGDVDIATPANASTNCPDGIVTAPDGGSTIIFSGGRLGDGESCTISVDVTATATVSTTFSNITSDLTSSDGNSGTATDDLMVDISRPAFSKSFAPSLVPFGSRSTLTFTIDNMANQNPAFGVRFSDTLPTGMEVAVPANASHSCNQGTLTATAGTSIISFADGLLLAGTICTITVDVIATANGLLDNVTGELLSISGFTQLSSGKASATLEVTATQIALSKSFSDDPVPPGGTVELAFTINNFNRIDSATDIAFIDDLATLVPTLAGLTFDSLLSNDCGGSVSGVGSTTIDFSGGTLEAESFCTIRASLTVPGGAVPGIYTNKTNNITAGINGDGVTGNMAADDLFVEPVPLLTKEFIGDPINAGDDVIIRFTITNTSTTSGAINIAFTDELTTFLPFPVSAVLPATPCGAGSTISLTFPDVDANQLSLTGGSLASSPGAGSTCTFDVTLTVPEGFPGGIYTNTTDSITATVDGTTRTGNPASDDLTVISAPGLSKAFTNSPAAFGSTITLEFSLTHSPDALGDATLISFTDNLAPVLAGLTATFPVTPDPPCGAGSALTGSAGDTLLSLTGGSLSPGENCIFSVNLNVPVSAAAGEYINTSSGVSATVDGQTVTSAPAVDSLNITGLTFSKEFIDDPVVPGETTTLRFTLENTDMVNDASGIVFTDNLADVLPGVLDLNAIIPPTVNTCGGTLSGTSFLIYSGGNLMSGDSCTIDVTINVPPGVADGSYNNSTSPLVATQGASLINNNLATDTLIVNANLLQLTKEFTNDPVIPGNTGNLRFTLTNLDAGQAASNVAFSDNLDAAVSGLTFTNGAFAACGGMVNANPDNGTIDFTGGSLNPGEECTFDVSVDVPVATIANIYPNTTSPITGMIGGSSVSGDAANDELVVVELLSFNKSFDGLTTATGTPALTFTLTNPGSNAVTGLAFSDDLNNVINGLIATNLPLSNICGSGSILSGTGFLTLTGGSLPPNGGMCSFDVELLVPGAVTSGIFPSTTSDLFQSGLLVASPAISDLVVEPPPVFSKGFSPAIVGVGLVSTLTFSIDNSASAVAASNLAFTDTLPSGLVIATPPNVVNNCNGSVIATNGSNLIDYSSGNVGAGTACLLQVDVLGTASGLLVNTTGDLTSSSGNSGPASDTLTTNPQPLFSKSFSPNAIVLGGISTLTFSLDNTLSTVDASALNFTDNLPGGLMIASPANASTTCVGGNLTTTSGTSIISYSGGTLPARNTCTLQVDISASGSGLLVNTSGNLASSLGNSDTASDDITVNPPPMANQPPAFSLNFSPNVMNPGGVTQLSFIIDNSFGTANATALDFTNNLPGGLMIASPANASSTCAGGAFATTSGTSIISYSGGTLAAGNICTLHVDISSSATGLLVNTSGNLTSSLGNSGTASDSITVNQLPTNPIPAVNPPPTFNLDFSPNVVNFGGVTQLIFTIDNSLSTVTASGLDFSNNLPSGLTVSTPANASTTCVGGTLSAVAGANTFAYSGGTVTAGSSCTVSVEIIVNVLGPVATNITSDLMSSLGLSSAASGLLTVNMVGAVEKIPTMQEWALLLLSTLLLLLTWRRLNIVR